ncbi:MAG: hypothetical protein ACT4ON_05850 [Bacteroidota bacterium]
MEDNKDLIEAVLKNDPQDIAFEEIPEENDSPLAQPVVQKSNTSGDVNASKNKAKETTASAEEKKEEPKKVVQEKPSDAPEQEIDAEPTEEEKKESASGTGNGEGEFSMPLEHAGLMADSIIGTINNSVLEVGAGYFVTIRKHKDFYDFEELIQVIEEQNTKNIKRIKLDEEDKALLRPLLIHILRKKAAALSPEKQLLMVALSIIIKKAKVVMEIRSENEMLVERIRDIIRKEVRGYEEEQEEESKQQETTTDTTQKKDKEEAAEVVYEETVQTRKEGSKTGLPDSALETFE